MINIVLVAINFNRGEVLRCVFGALHEKFCTFCVYNIGIYKTTWDIHAPSEIMDIFFGIDTQSILLCCIDAVALVCIL